MNMIDVLLIAFILVTYVLVYKTTYLYLLFCIV
jgi:hypothetical protein